MTRRDKDPFDELFKKMLEDFFGETGAERRMSGFFDEFDDLFRKFNREDFWEAVDEKKQYSSEKPFHFGFSIKKGPGGETEVSTFGDDVEKEEREPLVDVFDDEKHVMVTAEIPGASEEEILLDVEGEKLLIDAEGEGTNYSKEIDLPSSVEKEPVSREYKNGVLSLKFEKK